jgi:hypothetical protein
VDAERIAAFEAPLYVIEPAEAPRQVGWSWELQNGETIFGEAGYVTDTGGHIRVRTWRKLPEGRREAIRAHVADLVANAAAGVTVAGDEHESTIVVSGHAVPARASTLGRFRFVTCIRDGRLITVAHPADAGPPALTTLVHHPLVEERR